MERRSIKKAPTLSPTVVRQFVSSRIERQLLAQVFEVIVHTRLEDHSAACLVKSNSTQPQRSNA
jgi:hypothetical protein